VTVRLPPWNPILAMGVHPPDHRLVHPLPTAPQFVGRKQELGELRALWLESTPGMVALVGLGGAGKTAIAARFLEELCQPDQARRPMGLFVRRPGLRLPTDQGSLDLVEEAITHASIKR
jgi:hypothetical protein